MPDSDTVWGWFLRLFKGTSLISDFEDIICQNVLFYLYIFWLPIDTLECILDSPVIIQRPGTPLGNFCFWKQMVQFTCHCFKGFLSPLLIVSGLSGINTICPLQLVLDFFSCYPIVLSFFFFFSSYEES